MHLLPILQCLPLSVIKTFVQGQMEAASESTLRSLYFKGLSIDKILPGDVMQHILSYDGLYHAKTVSKKWKLLSDKNEAKYLRKIYQSTIVPPSQNQAGSTFIVHPTRTRKHPFEKSLGYKGPMDIKQALDRCDDGDRLLIHDGKYWKLFDDKLYIKKSIRLIGLGKKAFFKTLCHGFDSWFQVGYTHSIERKTVSIENISFGSEPPKPIEEKSLPSPEYSQSPIFGPISPTYSPPTYSPPSPMYSERPRTRCILITGSECNVSIKNCRFCNFPGIAIGNQSTSRLNVTDCVFEDIPCGVCISFGKDTTISNCLFKHCGRIDQREAYHSIVSHLVDSNMNCIGNVFKSCYTPPIVSQADRHYGIQRSQRYMKMEDHSCILMDNSIKGDIAFDNMKIEENVLYRYAP